MKQKGTRSKKLILDLTLIYRFSMSFIRKLYLKDIIRLILLPLHTTIISMIIFIMVGLIPLITVPSSLYAATTISEDIREDTVWKKEGGPYIIITHI